ncbi:MAG: exo-alpha-sialidase [Phycisphaerae bacterium]|nr:exo-alpha-sialidase [Phycisphaerae bacterium]
MTITAIITAAATLGLGPWRTYEVYRPTIERYFVADADAQPLKYNHDSSIAWFKDRWFCVWNANTVPYEGKPGQLNVVSTSRDGRTWSAPEAAFSSETKSSNPIPCPQGTQWQPNLIVVDDELWAVWDQNSKDEHAGCYVSRLKDPDGRWLNRRLLWDGKPKCTVDGKAWRPFPTQNPVRLRSGRVLAPVTLIGPKADDAPEGLDGWWASEKRNSVLMTDDAGKTWRASPGAIQPGRSWAQWEPTVWEDPNGTVWMVARNNDHRRADKGGPSPSEMLLWSRSADGGATWSPHEYVPLETVASRMHVLPAGGDRFVMVHNDWPASRFVADRYNLALFFTRGGGIDFVAGPGLTAREQTVAYPQMWFRDNAALISYSQGNQYRSIKVVHVSPLPSPDRYYLFPRSNVPPPPRPARLGDAFGFDGAQHVATRRVIEPGDDGFSIGAWVRPEAGGVLLDTRSGNPSGGFVCGLDTRDLRPFVHLATAEGNIKPPLPLDRGRWDYVGLTVDNRTGLAMFHVNDKVHGITFRPPAPIPLRGTTGYIGTKRMPSSTLPAFIGEIRVFEVYGALLDAAQHNVLHNRFAAMARREALAPAETPTGAPILRLDPADRGGLEKDFVLPADSADRAEVGTVDGRQSLLLTGNASAGVDLDENDRGRGDGVEFGFKFELHSGKNLVICTVGDADQPARLIIRDGRLWLATSREQRPCGTVRQGQWTDVRITTEANTTTAAVNGAPPVSVTHKPSGTWIYLGQGYRSGAASQPVDGQIAIDVQSVRSRVE